MTAEQLAEVKAIFTHVSLRAAAKAAKAPYSAVYRVLRGDSTDYVLLARVVKEAKKLIEEKQKAINEICQHFQPS